VRVERHDQLRRRHARPDAEVERVLPHHPAHEEIEPLAPAAGRRPRKKVADAWTRRHAPVRRSEIECEGARRKTVERQFDVRGGWIVAFEKEALDRSAAVDHLPQHPKERHQVAIPRPAVDEAGKGWAVACGIESTDVLGRTAAHDGQQALDRLQDAGHASERQRARAEADHFAIVGA
jgi:hypothetical protein